MDFYLTATFIGTDQTFGYTNGEEYELSVHMSNEAIKIYDCPNGQEWDFSDMHSFFQNWSMVSLKP